MGRGTAAREPLETQVECALAFGRSRQWICDRYGVDEAFIARVLTDQALTVAADPWYQEQFIRQHSEGLA